MAAILVLHDQVEVPLGLETLSDFRGWILSDSCPDRGRIDFVGGRIEVDMSPEELFAHGTLKGEIYAALLARVKQRKLGHCFTDSTRVTCLDPELSVEPDVVFVSREATASGRVRLVPKSTGEPGRYVELEGPPDLIVEIVSDGSLRKDTERLPEAYFKAGVREFWLVDARKEVLLFRIHYPGAGGYHAAEPDADGYQFSQVLGCRFRLERSTDEDGHWAFDLRSKD